LIVHVFVGAELCKEWPFDVWMAHYNLHCAESAGIETPLHELCTQELLEQLNQKSAQPPVVVGEDCYGKPPEV